MKIKPVLNLVAEGWTIHDGLSWPKGLSATTQIEVLWSDGMTTGPEQVNWFYSTNDLLNCFIKHGYLYIVAYKIA